MQFLSTQRVQWVALILHTDTCTYIWGDPFVEDGFWISLPLLLHNLILPQLLPLRDFPRFSFLLLWVVKMIRNTWPHQSALCFAVEREHLSFIMPKLGPNPEALGLLWTVLLFASSMKVNSTWFLLASSAETESCWAAPSSLCAFSERSYSLNLDSVTRTR